jgi:hypothetical protein
MKNLKETVGNILFTPNRCKPRKPLNVTDPIKIQKRRRYAEGKVELKDGSSHI